MRYIIAMACGWLCAIIAAVFISGPASRWLSTRMVYDSPDGQNSVEQMVFLAVMVGAMAIGWAIGWAIGSPYAKRERLD